MVNRELESIVQQKPVLWVGAGLSVAAGYPSTGAIVSAMREVADRDLPGDEFTAVVDAFVGAVGPGEVGDVLQVPFQAPHEPTPTHTAIARLAATGRFTAIVTTNYDDLLERALAAAGVKVVVQTLERNAAVREQDGALRLYKLHGSYTDWYDVILSGRSYADFDARHDFLRRQFDVLLQQHPLLFTGCSLQDPRVLQWLEARPAGWLTKLKRWRAIMQPASWAAAQNMAWKGGKAGAVLMRAPLRPIEYQAHADLPTLWLELARKLAPLAVGELVFDLHPDEDTWRSIGPTPESEPHIAPNLLHDDEFLLDLQRLHPLLHRSVQANQPDARAQIAEARHIARKVGTRLTATLLSPAAQEAVRLRLAEVDRGTARLTLRVVEGPNADPALALPWELLMPEDDHFPVETFKLDVVRDAVKPGAPDLEVPSKPLSVAATIAAPEDQTTLRYEDESYRMLKALAPLGQVAYFAELGAMNDLVDLVDRTHATAVHFSGHGLPGKLVFEDELGLSREVSVTELTARLRQRVQKSGVPRPFPRLFYLAACHGASATPTPSGAAAPVTRTLRAEISAALGEGPSTAATLHREGFACVLGYFGPIGDAVSTSAEVALYTALSGGDTILHAVKQARAQLSESHTHADQRYHYPLGWAQLAVYLRGPDRPLTATPQKPSSAVPVPSRLAREVVEVSGLPVLEHGFIGRRGLQHEVRRKLKEGQRLFVLQGLGGLGKTALASQILCNVLTRDRADQLILRAGDSLDLARLRRQAEEHGNTHGLVDWADEVQSLLERHPDPIEGFAQTVLALHAHRPGLVLYVDNMEDLQLGPGGAAELEPGALGTWRPGVERWWATIESLSRHVLVLASTRYLWNGLDPDALVALDRMSRADLWRMLDTFPTLRKLPWSAREKVTDTADGRPRTLEHLANLLTEANRDPTHSITDAWKEWVAPVLAQYGDTLTGDLLLAQLWRCISQAARDQAIAAAVLLQPAPRRVLDAMGLAAGELIRAGLLTRHRELAVDRSGDTPRLAWKDRWSMHASVRQFASAWGTTDDLRRARTRAANEYAVLVAEPGALWSDQIEAIELHLANNDGPSAWPLARDYMVWLQKRAQYMEALKLLGRFMLTNMQDDAHAELIVLGVQLRGAAGLKNETDEQMLRAIIKTSISPEIKSVARNALSSLLSRQGNYPEAERLLRDTLSIEAKALGRKPRSYGATLYTLAGVLARQGKNPEAERLLRDALLLIEKTRGREHPDCGSFLHALGDVLYQQGNYLEAERLLRDALAIDEKALGHEHPDYGASLHALAAVLSARGNYPEAERLLRDVLALNGKALGRDHPDYGASLNNLADVLIAQGNYPEAESLLRDALSIKAKALGLKHPSYCASIRNLARVLSAQGNLPAAKCILRASLLLLEKALGPEHPELRPILASLAVVAAKQGRAREGVPLLERALTIGRAALGENHPDVQQDRLLLQELKTLL